VATRALCEVKPATSYVFEVSNPLVTPFELTDVLFWDRIYEAGSECQEKKANFSEGAPEELKGVAD
jgi:hypothetical protein